MNAIQRDFVPKCPESDRHSSAYPACLEFSYPIFLWSIRPCWSGSDSSKARTRVSHTIFLLEWSSWEVWRGGSKRWIIKLTMWLSLISFPLKLLLKSSPLFLLGTLIGYLSNSLARGGARSQMTFSIGSPKRTCWSRFFIDIKSFLLYLNCIRKCELGLWKRCMRISRRRCNWLGRSTIFSWWTEMGPLNRSKRIRFDSVDFFIWWDQKERHPIWRSSNKVLILFSPFRSFRPSITRKSRERNRSDIRSTFTIRNEWGIHLVSLWFSWAGIQKIDHPRKPKFVLWIPLSPLLQRQKDPRSSAARGRQGVWDRECEERICATR